MSWTDCFLAFCSLMGIIGLPILQWMEINEEKHADKLNNENNDK